MRWERESLESVGGTAAFVLTAIDTETKESVSYVFIITLWLSAPSFPRQS